MTKREERNVLVLLYYNNEIFMTVHIISGRRSRAVVLSKWIFVTISSLL